METLKELFILFESPIRAMELLFYVFITAYAMKLINDVRKELKKNGHHKSIEEIKKDVKEIKSLLEKKD